MSERHWLNVPDGPGGPVLFGWGWAHFERPGLGLVRTRLAKVDGHWRAVELYIDGGGEPIQPGALRALRVGEIEAWLDEWPWPWLLPGFGAEAGTPHDYPPPIEVRAVFPELPDLVEAGLTPDAAISPPRAQPTLSAPQHGLTDAFFTDVARVYGWAVAHGLPPAKELARQAGVDQRTAQGWVYKARKRGLMPPAKSRGRIV